MRIKIKCKLQSMHLIPFSTESKQLEDVNQLVFIVFIAKKKIGLSSSRILKRKVGKVTTTSSSSFIDWRCARWQRH